MAELGAGGVTSFPGATPGSPYPQYFGIFFGVVNNNSDPLKQNRCLLQVPQLFGTAVTTWAVSLTPLQNPPAVGTVITAMFIGGDVDYPVYLVTDPQILVENTAGNIQPVGTASAAGTSKKLAAADHVHTLANALESTAGNIQPDGTGAAGVSPKAARGDHVHPQPSSPTFSNLTVTGTIQTQLLDVNGFSIGSEPTPTITTVPHNPNDPTYGGAGGGSWLSGERAALDNQVDIINQNFVNVVAALQAGGLWH